MAPARSAGLGAGRSPGVSPPSPHGNPAPPRPPSDSARLTPLLPSPGTGARPPERARPPTVPSRRPAFADVTARRSSPAPRPRAAPPPGRTHRPQCAARRGRPCAGSCITGRGALTMDGSNRSPGRGTAVTDDFYPSRQCLGFRDGLCKTMATARKSR